MPDHPDKIPPVEEPVQDLAIHLEDRDDDISLSDLRWDDALVLFIFWVLAGVVFLQFFTRYVLNDSLGWTEEIARYLLIGVTFAGSMLAARKRSHIAVEFLYRWVPRPIRRVMQTVIDVITVAFFGVLVLLTIQLAGRTGQMMVSIDVPKAYVYYFVAASFAGMTLYCARNAIIHLKTGTSPLIDPEAFEDEIRAID